MQATPTHHRPDVQALRGIAVMLVVAFHAWPAAVPGGYVGVDVFFVISGYLITGMLIREVERTGRIDYGDFYARRARRLVPAAALVILTVVLLAPLMLPALDSRTLWLTAVASAGYASNLLFAVLAVDYLQEGLQRNLLLHTWSLGVEEQFYLVWPLLVAASTALSARLGTRRALAWMVAAVSVLSLAASLWLTVAWPSWAFFGLPTRAWELGTGASAVLLERGAARWSPAARRVIAVAGLACIVGAAWAYSAATRYPGHAAIVPVAGSLLFVLAGSQAADGGTAVGRVAPGWLRRLGDWSYAWYLWHWPVLIVLAERWPAADRNLVAAVGVAASLALARLTHAAVENPIRHHASLTRARPALSLVLAVVLLGVTIAAASVSRIAVLATGQADPRRRLETAMRDRPSLYHDRCFASAPDIVPPDCLYGRKGAQRTVALIGDSHAAQWFPALEWLAQTHGFRLAVFVKAACPVARVEPLDPKLGRPYVECTRWRHTVFERLAELRPALIVGASASRYAAFTSRDPALLGQWREALDLSLAQLTELAPQVVLIADTPMPGFHVPNCLARAATRDERRDPGCTYLLSQALVPAALEVEQAAAAGRPGVAVVDLGDAICADAVCPVERDGMVLFHDSQHLSATFARSLAQRLWQRLPAAARAGLVE